MIRSTQPTRNEFLKLTLMVRLQTAPTGLGLRRLFFLKLTVMGEVTSPLQYSLQSLAKLNHLGD